MKKNSFILALLISLFSLGSIAQESRTLVAEFGTMEQLITVDGESSYSAFIMMADKQQLEDIVAASGNHGSFITFGFEEEKNANGTYNCKFTFDHKTSNQELAKYMLLFGVNNLKIAEKDYTTLQLINM